jgi:hypothetical protein
MTPEEWEGSRDPRRMLEFLRDTGRVRDRQLRLFAAACCRRVWPLLRDPRSRRAVEAAEAFAHGLTARGALGLIRGAAWEAFVELFHAPSAWAAVWAGAAYAACEAASGFIRPGGSTAILWEPGRGWGDAAGVAYHAAEAIASEAAGPAAGVEPNAAVESAKAAARSSEWRGQAELLGCVFGSPFVPVPTLDPAALAWNGSAALRLAEAIYASRRFEDLPVLADLLEEASLTDAALLGHLRGPGPHALGCFALDAVLGKS